MNFNESLEIIGCRELWQNFVTAINEPVLRYGDKPHLAQEHARISIESLQAHEVIMQELYNRLLKDHVGEAEYVRWLQAFEAELAEQIICIEAPSLPISGVPNNDTIEAREAATTEASWLGGLAYAFKVSPERKARLEKRWQALKKIGEALEQADYAVKKRVNDVSETYGFGAQLGPGYFRGKKPIYSGPQNAPLKPSGDTDFIMSESECWCVYCNTKVTKSPEDLMTPCEHLVCTKCGGMLGSKVTMPDDKRVYDYGDLKKHPHSGDKT